MTNREIKKLKNQVEWYQEKLDEMNSIHYGEGRLVKMARRIEVLYENEGIMGVFKKAFNPRKIYYFIKVTK